MYPVIAYNIIFNTSILHDFSFDLCYLVIFNQNMWYFRLVRHLKCDISTVGVPVD